MECHRRAPDIITDMKVLLTSSVRCHEVYRLCLGFRAIVKPTMYGFQNDSGLGSCTCVPFSGSASFTGSCSNTEDTKDTRSSTEKENIAPRAKRVKLPGVAKEPIRPQSPKPSWNSVHPSC